MALARMGRRKYRIILMAAMSMMRINVFMGDEFGGNVVKSCCWEKEKAGLKKSPT